MPLFHCNICSQDISRVVRIKCAECIDYDLCVSCFLNAAYSGSHKAWHSYMVIETESYPILDEDWGADEELLLIEGLQMHGIGNWADVAEHIGTARTKQECEQHYMTYYLNSSQYPYPEAKQTIEIDREMFQERKRRRIEERLTEQKATNSVSRQKILSSTPAFHEVHGYMPCRLEFESEFENEAENSVKDLVFDEDLSNLNEFDVQLKLLVLSIYNSRLDRRIEKKRLIFEHRLLEFKKIQSIERKRTKEERDLMQQLRVYARVMNGDDYRSFFEDMLEELAIRKQIKELQEWRKVGIRTIEDGQQFEKEVVQRNIIRGGIGVAGANSPKDPASINLRLNALNQLNASANNSSNTSTDSKIGRKSSLSLPQSTDSLQLLTQPEQALCSSLRLFPKAYLVLKELLFRESFRAGGNPKKKHLKEVSNVDSSKLMKIFEFLSQSGWI